MAYTTVFKRYEMKYLLSQDQKRCIMGAILPFMKPDEYGRSNIRNLYFDTDDYRLIRRSIEKPVYKEKLRIRSYGRADEKSDVFIELKKKYKSCVYKRRLSLPWGAAKSSMNSDLHIDRDGQIAEEINYFVSYYGSLHPAVFLSYDREAFFCKSCPDFRITFDENILCRRDDLTLESSSDGFPLLEGDRVLMELKCSGAIPLWMAHALSEEHLYRTSFSKYGSAYEKIILTDRKEFNSYAQFAV